MSSDARAEGPTEDPAVNAYLAAFADRDVDRLLGLVAQEAVWTIPGDAQIVPWVGTHRGRETLRYGYYAPLFEAVEPLAFDVLHSHASAGAVFVNGRFTFRFHPSEEVLEDELVVRFTTADGLITSFRIYEDSLAVARAYTGDPGLGLV
ncbi:nuclear transport factor 2 family protein [Streptomyces qinglanensis]|uniref:nuclear transport factor 2 family protein n=1 Tax=Streptomyces qinglanensis TaxID=943816 RepID=UPI003D716DF6